MSATNEILFDNILKWEGCRIFSYRSIKVPEIEIKSRGLLTLDYPIKPLGCALIKLMGTLIHGWPGESILRKYFSTSFIFVGSTTRHNSLLYLKAGGTAFPMSHLNIQDCRWVRKDLKYLISLRFLFQYKYLYLRSTACTFRAPILLIMTIICFG